MYIREDWVRNTEFHPLAPAAVLQQVTNQVKESLEKGQIPVVVFDLDSTLFDVSPRSYHILQEWLDHPETNGFEPTKQLLTGLDVKEIRYSLDDVWSGRKIQFDQNPYDAHFRHAKRYWRDRLFSHDYLHHDVPTSGAVSFVKSLYDAGSMIVYLTGRDVPSMGFGTFEQLKRHQLPIELPRTRLIMKPKRHHDDLDFKTGAAQAITELGPVVASFENEPKNLVAMSEIFEKAKKPNQTPTMNVFIHTVSSDHGAPPGKGIFRIDHFEY